MSNVSDFVVRATDGSIDSAASLAAFTTALSQYVAQRSEEMLAVGAAVNAAFAPNPGASITLPELHSTVWTSLGKPANFKALAKQVGDFVHSNPQTFVVSKGRGGGVSLRTASNAATA